MRAPHIRTEKIYSIKKRKFSSDGHSLIERGSRDDDGVEREGAAWNHTRPAQAPHPSMSTFLQSLMKVREFDDLTSSWCLRAFYIKQCTDFLDVG